MAEQPDDIRDQALRLAFALQHIRARVREQSGADYAGLTLTQLAILGHLHHGGPMTAVSLSAAEHVSQQAIAQSVAALKVSGLVEATPDPTDGRKVLIGETDRGRELRQDVTASRSTWLARALEAVATDAERADLDRFIELLDRIARSDV